MLHALIVFDTKLFYFLNSTVANPFFDWLMPFITNQNHWYLLFVMLVLFLILKGGKKGIVVILLLFITILLSDQLSSQILKPLIGRIRPCYSLPDVRLLIPCGGQLAFPSGHATNSFAASLILSYFYPRFAVFLFLIASLVSFSRIYVGVHYPLDVVAGIILGLLCGKTVLYLYNSVKNKYNINFD
ncbi:MAG: phosphatase PAP2 family protein [Calditrichaeota bacterium]|nr:MAG: phosphatase PAP2 family protein [Calditrichota bacterium]